MENWAIVRGILQTKEYVEHHGSAHIWQETNKRKQVPLSAARSNENTQDMYITTAPSLFFGLGARIFVNKFIYHYDSSTIPDFVFLGLWQGTAVYYLLMRQVEFAWAASVGILGRLLIDFVQNWDTSRCACTLLGVALGILVTDIASQIIEDESGRPAIFGGTAGSPSSGHRHHRRRPSRRLVQFSRSNSRVEPVRDKGKEVARDGGRDRERPRHPKHKDEKLEDFKRMRDWESRSIITADSITSSDLIHPKSKMTPLQREVANLRAKASLADTERRRFKEEKQWALSQGNAARAEQMGWQVKRYAALVDSFHKEADAKLLEGASSFAFVAFGISSRPGYQRLGSSLSNGQNRTQHLYDQKGPKRTQTLSRPHLHLPSSASNSPGRDAAPPPSSRPYEYLPESGYCRHLNDV